VKTHKRILNKVVRTLKYPAKLALRAVSVVYHTTVFALASAFVLNVIYQPQIDFIRGTSVVSNGNDPQGNYMIHELFPNATWNDLEPCGIHFNEQEEFNKALQCVNTSVWPDTPITRPEYTHIPRCYVVKAHSADVYTKPDAGFNFVPIFEPTPAGIAVGAVVGVYQPETRTVFIIENIDAPSIYRHELQHYFLHEHDPETEGGGHDQLIWERCEPPYYTPSEAVLRNVRPGTPGEK
jgi:hypothetical protein